MTRPKEEIDAITIHLNEAKQHKERMLKEYKGEPELLNFYLPSINELIRIYEDGLK